jgi:hypothetical protein
MIAKINELAKTSPLKNIFIGFGMLFLLTILAIHQQNLKPNPKLILLGFSGLTILSILKFPKWGIVMFYLLIGLPILIIGFIGTNYLLDFFNPDRGWYIDTHDGQRYPIMAMSGVLGIPIGLLLAIFMVFLYHRKVGRNNLIETTCVTLYSIVTAATYLLTEMF